MNASDISSTIIKVGAVFLTLLGLSGCATTEYQPLEGGPAPAANIEALRLRGHELADGKVPATSNPGAATIEQQAVTTPGDVSRAESAEVPELDDALLHIFTSEAEGHISTIREELGQCREQGSCFASASLIRAAHTLAGSARSVGLEFMSSTCKEMEKLLQGLDEKQAVLSNRQLQILDGVADAITALLAALETDRAQLPQTTQKFVELGSELRTELAGLPDVDESPQVATRYNIESIPTLLVFNDGQIVQKAMGFHDEGEVRRLLQP